MEKKSEKKKHFVLVHGSCHGAWCWYKVVTLLRPKGHRVTVLDMAAAGVHPKRLEELPTFSDYCDPLLKFMADLAPHERVILVGHSLGGLCISLAMERFPQNIDVAVFVASSMPGPDFDDLAAREGLKKQMGSLMDSLVTVGNEADIFCFGPEFLSTKLYQLSPPEDLALATLLMRPTPVYRGPKYEKEMVFSKEKYGTVRRVYMICENDKIINLETQQWMIENNPCDEEKIIHGADHMAMFSKPQEMTFFLLEIAENY